MSFFGLTHRNIGIFKHMNAAIKGDKAMEILIPLGILVAWIILQAWILPRFGMQT